MATSVLVVDDDALFRGLAARMLVDVGLLVAGEAGTVAAAAAAAAELRPDAALVDVGLPDGDGVALAGRLVALPWRPRVVLTSSDPDAVTADIARAAGVVAFVPKADLDRRSLRDLLAGNSQ